MIRSVNEIIAKAKQYETLKMTVACPYDAEVMKALDFVKQEGIVQPILFGDKTRIEGAIKEINGSLDDYEINDYSDDAEACLKAVELVSSKEAHLVMKGLVDTKIILQAVLNKEVGLRTGNLLSHTAVVEVPSYDRLFYVTDGAMNITPSVEDKKQIIENAIEVAHALGNPDPIVGVLAAVEKINPKMDATLHAEKLVEMNKNGEIKGCRVTGPFALDNAVSEEAAKHKGMDNPLAGNVDVLLVPRIESGNVLYKSMMYFAKSKSAGIICGAQAPVVLLSRSDSYQSKINSIALGVLVALNKK